MKLNRISVVTTFGMLLVMLVAVALFATDVASAGGGPLPTPTLVMPTDDPSPEPSETDAAPTPTQIEPTPVPTDTGSTPDPTLTPVPTQTGPKSERYTYRGETAYARFESFDPTTCITTLVTVLGTNSTIKADGAPSLSSGSWVAIFRYNACTWETISYASGYGSLGKDNYSINKQLNAATLNTSLWVTDFYTGEARNVQIQLTWTGTGDIDRNHDGDHYEGPGYKFSIRMDARARMAVAVGTISDGVTNYAEGESTYADLASIKQASMLLQTNH